MRNFWKRCAGVGLALGVLAGSAGTALPAAAAEPIEISKTAKRGFEVPTLRIASLSGDAETVAAVKRYLSLCGWFRVVDGADADYVLNGTATANRIELAAAMNGNQVYRRVLTGTLGPRRMAARAVDELLEARFKVRLCDTRIAFCAEVRPGIKAIWLCDIDGGNVLQLTHFSTSCVEPGWMPDANSVVYTRYTNAGTDVLQTAISPVRTRRVTAFPGTNVGAAVHPTGNFLALVMSVDHQVELYVKSFALRDRRRLTRSKAAEASPVWSPDGGQICFVSDETGSPKLYVIGANGGSYAKLPTVGSEAVTPDWSNDGKIVYAAKISGEYKLAVLDRKGQESGPVPNLKGSGWEAPSWAPDGRHVVASLRSGRKSVLYVVDTKTGAARQLGNFSVSTTSPAWSGLR